MKYEIGLSFQRRLESTRLLLSPFISQINLDSHLAIYVSHCVVQSVRFQGYLVPVL